MYDNRVFSIRGEENSMPPPPVQVQPHRPVPLSIPEPESDMMETDDIVNNVVRDVIDCEIGYDTDEEVVYPRSVRVLCVSKVYDQLSSSLLKYQGTT